MVEAVPPPTAPDWLGASYRRIQEQLLRADAAHNLDRLAEEEALLNAAEAACTALKDLVWGDSLRAPLDLIESMSEDDAAVVITQLRGERFDEFLAEELRLLNSARFDGDSARHLIEECRAAILTADPSAIVGTGLRQSIKELTSETCRVASVQAERMKLIRDQASRTQTKTFLRHSFRLFGGVVIMVVDFSVLAVGSPDFVEKGSAIVGAALASSADVLFPGT